MLGEASPRAMGRHRVAGRTVVDHLLAGAIRAQGIGSAPVDAADIVRTDAGFQSAVPDADETRRLSQARVVPMLTAGTVPVITGFVGSTAAGVVTTLGRGGSDYSAAILGAALDADEVWIYTDVDGGADRRPARGHRRTHARAGLVSTRRNSPISAPRSSIRRRRCRRSSAASRCGSKNTFNPGHPGTLVVATVEAPAGARTSCSCAA